MNIFSSILSTIDSITPQKRWDTTASIPIFSILLSILFGLFLPGGQVSAQGLPGEEFRKKSADCAARGGVFAQSPWDSPAKCFMKGDRFYDEVVCLKNGNVLLASEEYGQPQVCISQKECQTRGGRVSVNMTSLLSECFVSPDVQHKGNPEVGEGLQAKLMEWLPKEVIFAQFYYYLKQQFPEFKCYLTKDGKLLLTADGTDVQERIKNSDFGGDWRVMYKTLMIRYNLPLNNKLEGHLGGSVKIKLDISNGKLIFDGVSVGNGPLMEGSLRERLKKK